MLGTATIDSGNDQFDITLAQELRRPPSAFELTRAFVTSIPEAPAAAQYRLTEYVNNRHPLAEYEGHYLKDLFQRNYPKTAAYLGLANEHWIKPGLAGFNKWATGMADTDQWTKWGQRQFENTADHFYNNRKRYGRGAAVAGVLLLAGGLTHYFLSQSDNIIVEPEAEPIAEFAAETPVEPAGERDTLCGTLISLANGIEAAKQRIADHDAGKPSIVGIPPGLRRCVAQLTPE